MRIIIYIVILAVVFMLPVNRLDIAKLEPVEAVAVYEDHGYIVLKTDQESEGKGKTALEALQDLKDRATSVVYLDTADYLLVGEKCEQAAQELLQCLKKSVKIGTYRGGDVKEEARYLDVHREAAKPTG